MKLLRCRVCFDVVALGPGLRECWCTKSRGTYIDDINAEVSGPCDVIGFNNQSLAHALANRRTDYGTPFEAFIIPETARTIKRKD